ncbi:MAG: radical SAM protein [Elusimicrobiota bacterium]
MKIVFIYNGAESLGIEYISSLLKSKGHETFLLFDPSIFSGEVFVNIKKLANLYSVDNTIVKTTLELKPDLIAFSSYTGNYRWCLGIAKAIKQISKIPIVFGGVHPTAVPEKVLSNDFIDFVIVGEGEFAMLDLVENLSQSEPKKELLNKQNICLKHENHIYINKPRPYIQDLDSLPFPDKNLFFNQEPFFRNNPYLVITSRGCPYNCTYCSNNMYRKLYCDDKQHVRRRSVDNVIQELSDSKKQWDIKHIHFMDDVFTLSEHWLGEFIEKYKSKINLPFFCYTNPLSLTKEIAGFLKKGGCYLTGMGIQSGSERIRREIFHRFDTNDRIVKAVSYLKANKINIQADHILGAPSEDENDLKKGLELYRIIKPEILLVNWLTYYPKTEIVKTAIKSGDLSEHDIDKIEEGYIGYTHSAGSINKEKIPLFQRYELMFELVAIFHNDKFCSLLLKIVTFIPFKKTISMFIYAITGLKYNKKYVFNKFYYAFSKIIKINLTKHFNSSGKKNIERRYYAS